MKGLRSLALVVLAAISVWAGSSGIPPRSQASQYAASGGDTGVAIGAMQLSKHQVRDAFRPDLNHDYLVVEVGIFPRAGSKIAVSRGQFTLTTVAGQELDPAGPQQVANAIARKNGWDRTSTRRDIGVGVDAGHGADIDNGTPLPNVDVTEGTMTTIGRRQSSINRVAKELAEKMLPEGTFATPAAGYLLFLRPAGKSSSYRLRFQGDTQTIELTVPAAQ